MSETKGKTVASLRSALAACSEEDLTDLQNDIAELEKQIAGLRELERLVDRRLHGKPARATKAAGTATAERLCDRIKETILANGPGTVRDLSLKLNRKEAAIRMAINRQPEAFKLDGNRWCVRLTD